MAKSKTKGPREQRHRGYLPLEAPRGLMWAAYEERLKNLSHGLRQQAIVSGITLLESPC
jgi:hypothetical protein